MRTFLELARTGVTAVLLHRLRSAVTTASLIVVLLPYLIGLGISRGVQEDAAAAVRFGADLYVTGEKFGRPVPVPLAAAARLREIPGVASVVPRIVGRVELGIERVSAVVVGMPPEGLPAGMECVAGRLCRDGARNELVVGSDLARRLNLVVGSLIPPFYRSRHGERISEVVGIFRANVSLWQARLIVTSLDAAGRIFDEPELATDLLVNCRPGYAEMVAQAILRLPPLGVPENTIRPRITTRQDLAVLLSNGPQHREGIFTLLFVLAFAVGILVVLVTSGFGSSDRRREIAILKATGWQIDELLFRNLVESSVLAVGGAAIAILMAYAWLAGLNGYWIAGVFLADVDRLPSFDVPFRLAPVPVLIAFMVSLVVVLVGSVYSTWRTAITPPRTAMR